MPVEVRPITEAEIRQLLADRFPDGEPEFETRAWHDWSGWNAALRLVEKKKGER